MSRGRVSKGPSLPLTLLREIGVEDSTPGRKPRSNRPAPRVERWKPQNKSFGTRDKGPGRGARETTAHRTAKRKGDQQKPQTHDEEDDQDEDEYGSSEEDLSDMDGLEDTDDSDDSDENDKEERKIPKAVKDSLAQDDKEIADLERKLGIKGRKKLPKSFEDDGLGDLLQDIDNVMTEDVQEKRKRKADVDEWLAQKRRKASQANKNLQEEVHGSDSDVGSDQDEEMDEQDNVGADSEDESDAFEGFDSDAEPPEQASKPRRENPYVAPTAGQSAAKYVPPSLRAKTGTDDELALRIRRQTQGLVNRLTDANLVSILGDIEKLYREHPRQHVTSSLVDLLLIQVCDPSSLPDTLLILHAGFATAAYRVIGMDFGASLVQSTVERFKQHYQNAVDRARQQLEATKETSNIITFLAEMYNFQMIGCTLLFDYIRFLLGELSELNAELLLRIIRMSGKSLRHDDPLALKDIVALLRPAMAKVGEQNVSVRTKFMVETINDLKNNKLKAGASASAVNTEHTTRMKKLLGTLSSRKLKATEPLRMGLRDIEEADKKGKWWLVGSSWAGTDNTETKPNEKTAPGSQVAQGEDDPDDVDDFYVDDDLGNDADVDLEALARQQMMNTDVRKAIFFAVMSALDFEDAYRKLLKLKLNKERQREVSHVLLQCCGSEPQYNPYYALVARKISGEDRRMRWNFQDTLWKLFRRLGESLFDEEADSVDEDDDKAIELRRIVNIGKFYGTLIHQGVLGVDVLRCLNFMYLKAKTKVLVEVMLVTALLDLACEDRAGADEAIRRMFSLPGKPEFVRGLQYFMDKTLRKSELGGDKKRTKILRRREKVAEKTLASIVAEA